VVAGNIEQPVPEHGPHLLRFIQIAERFGMDQAVLAVNLQGDGGSHQALCINHNLELGEAFFEFFDRQARGFPQAPQFGQVFECRPAGLV